MRIWRDGTTAALVVFLVLLSFWGAVLLGEKAVRPDGMTSRPSVQFQPIDDDGKVIDPQKILTAPYFKDPIYHYV